MIDYSNVFVNELHGNRCTSVFGCHDSVGLGIYFMLKAEDELFTVLESWKETGSITKDVEIFIYLIFLYDLYLERYVTILNTLLNCEWYYQHENAF